MEIKILDSTDKKLREISKEVTDFNKGYYQPIIDKMKDICLKHPAYAAAAPQFGILERFILILVSEDMTGKEKEEIIYHSNVYFNPVVVSQRGKQVFYEGCMSVPDATGRVYRPYEVLLRYQDIDGIYHEKLFQGFEAIVVCHELDHLDGIEYTDVADEMIWNISLDDRIEIRKKYPHTILSKDCEYVKKLNR